MSVVRYERHGDVAHIVLANPPRNLINSAFSESLRTSVRQVSESDVRALLIRAEGPNFSDGGDILDFIEMNFDSWRTFILECHQAYRAIEALQIPSVAACRGSIYGGAFELALATDFIVASKTAVFRNIEASVGSAPVAGGVQRLAERVGRALAARYTMLSEPMSGETAGNLGVAAYVVDDAEVEKTANELTQRLATGPTQSYKAIRALLKAWSGGGVPAADTILLDVTMPLHLTEDARTGRTRRAEANKRGVEPEPPVFTGW
jgi:enoyl-CoA hydratase/carnithine racemase